MAPRSFTLHEIETTTVEAYNALSPEDKAAWNKRWFDWQEAQVRIPEDRDFDRVASDFRYEIGR